MKIPKLKPGVSIYLNGNKNQVEFIFQTKSLHKVFEVDPPVLLLIKLLENKYSFNKLYKEIILKYPDFKFSEYQRIISSLESENIIEDEINDFKNTFNQDEQIRYDRLLNFWSDFNSISSWEVQNNLRESTVVILGLGGTGSWIAQSLTMSGIGNLILIDDDDIELHNLTRQTLYFSKDIKLSKSIILKERLQLINPNTNITINEIQINHKTNLNPLFEQANLVINCTDFPDINITSSWVSKSCMELNIPHIVGGGYNGHTGLIGPTILPYKSACWNCFDIDFDEYKYDSGFQKLAGNDKSKGSLGPLSSIVANIQAIDALRVLGKFEYPKLINKTGELNLDDMSIKWNEIKQQEECPICNKEELIYD